MTRNAEIFKSIRERKIKLKELRGGGDVNMDDNGGGEEEEEEEEDFVENWSRQMDLENQNERKRLDEGLTSSKASSLKESIRLAHNDLGDYYYNIGDLKEAFQCYAKNPESTERPQETCVGAVRE